MTTNAISISVQGNILRQFYRSEGDYKDIGLKNEPNWFQITFEKSDGIPYCEPDKAKRDCTNGPYIRSSIRPLVAEYFR